MANKRGGAIVFGLDETESNIFEPVGIENKIDPTDLEKQLSKYLPSKLFELTNVIYTIYTESEYGKLKGKTFINIIVNYDPKYIPFMPLKDGDAIKKNTIYIRKNRATEPANYDDVQNILNRRVETEYTSSSERKLREHLEELKELYSHIREKISSGYSKKQMKKTLSEINSYLRKSNPELFEGGYDDDYVPPMSNPNYPEEDYEQFVSRMIKLKKNIIEDVLKK